MGCIEKELKILQVDLIDLIVSLEQIGAERVSMGHLCDHYFDKPDGSLKKDENKRIRIRYGVEGNKMTLKEKVKSKKIKKRKEEEFYVERSAPMHNLLSERGLRPQWQKYKTRMKYKFEDITYDIDLYPGIPPLVEIEASSFKKIKKGMKLVGLEKYDTSKGGARSLMKRYGKKPVPLHPAV